MTEVGLDPYAPDSCGLTPVHDALLYRNFTAHVLSGAYDLYRIARGPICPRAWWRPITEMEGAPKILDCLLRRWPRSYLAEFLDVWPPGFLSPLCNVAIHCSVDLARVLVRRGASVDFEGSVYGSPLMTAAKHGRLDIVQFLVGAGARVTYTVDGRGDGPAVIRSALQFADGFPAVRALAAGRALQPASRPSGTAAAAAAAKSGRPRRSSPGAAWPRSHMSSRDPAKSMARPGASPCWTTSCASSAYARALRGCVIMPHRAPWLSHGCAASPVYGHRSSPGCSAHGPEAWTATASVANDVTNAWSTAYGLDSFYLGGLASSTWVSRYRVGTP